MRLEFSEWMAIEAFVALSAAPLIWGLADGRIHTGRSLFAVLLIGVPVLGVVFRRRGSWLILLAFDGVVVLSYAWSWTGIVPFASNATAFALLLSPPTRRHVAKHTRADGPVRA